MGSMLSGQVAIVTGASSGIGRAAAERLVSEGARVVIADINHAAGEEVAEQLGPNAGFRSADVGDPEQVRDLVGVAATTYGRLDVMVNNAGISGVRCPSLIDEDFADFDRVIAVNLLGVMVGTREAARYMADNGGGSIVNISSIGALQSGSGLWSYSASKAAVVQFTKSAAVDLGARGIRVNCIAPGNIETPIMASAVAHGLPEDEKPALLEAVRAFVVSRQPLQRPGTTVDVANAVFYFASELSSFVTGAVLAVDGGMVAGSPAANDGFEKSIRSSASQ